MLPTTKFGPFTLGVNNRAHEFALPVGAVRDALNVDLTLEGRARTRAGMTLARSGTRVSSLWSDGSRAFFKDDTQLFELFNDLRVASLIFSGLSPLHDVVYCSVPGRGIAFSDSAHLRRIDGDVIKPFALLPPAAAPTLTAGVGSMPGGIYQVACSYRDAAGEETGLSRTSVITLADNSTLNLALPQPVDPEAIEILVYVTPQNGDQLYLAAIVPDGTMTLAFPVTPDQTLVPVTRFLEPLPAGDLLAFYHGRTYTHVNGLLLFTQPYSGQFNPASDYIPFPAPVTIVHPTSYGLWIVADQTYLLDEPGEKGELRRVNPIPAVAGTLTLLPDSEEAMWFTPEGMVITKPGGSLDFLQQDNVAVSGAHRGASVYRELDGLKQAITSLRNPSTQRGGASAWFSATLVSGDTRNEFDS